MNRFTGDTDPATLPASVVGRHEYATPHKTAVVVGIPQGGTSMVAAVVDAFSFPVSAALFNFENGSRPGANNTLEVWTAKVAEINGTLDVWGLKDTLVWRFPSETIHNALRNPYYLIVARDLVAVAQRRCANHAVTEPGHVASVLDQVETQARAMWQWVHDLPKAPVLLVSYERAIRQRPAFCRAVAAFLRVLPTDAQLQRAVDRISSDGGYLEKEETSREPYERIKHE